MIKVRKIPVETLKVGDIINYKHNDNFYIVTRFKDEYGIKNMYEDEPHFLISAKSLEDLTNAVIRFNNNLDIYSQSKYDLILEEKSFVEIDSIENLLSLPLEVKNENNEIAIKTFEEGDVEIDLPDGFLTATDNNEHQEAEEEQEETSESVSPAMYNGDLRERLNKYIVANHRSFIGTAKNIGVSDTTIRTIIYDKRSVKKNTRKKINEFLKKRGF